MWPPVPRNTSTVIMSLRLDLFDDQAGVGLPVAVAPAIPLLGPVLEDQDLALAAVTVHPCDDGCTLHRGRADPDFSFAVDQQHPLQPHLFTSRGGQLFHVNRVAFGNPVLLAA